MIKTAFRTKRLITVSIKTHHKGGKAMEMLIKGVSESSITPFSGCGGGGVNCPILEGCPRLTCGCQNNNVGCFPTFGPIPPGTPVPHTSADKWQD